MTCKKVLALNPFHGGSHKAFIEGWQKRSQHHWQILTLPDSHWKWRLQFAAVELAEKVKKLYAAGERWDIIFCTSMLNVADFRALTPELATIPLVVYFHENQLTYPASEHMKFDLSLAMINVKSALVAEHVWFNSVFHRDDFLAAVVKVFGAKPGKPEDILATIREKSLVQYQAIDDAFGMDRKVSLGTPLKIVWAARWELDKNPGLLFMALRHLRSLGIAFELYFLGEEKHTNLSCIEQGRIEFAAEIKAFGYAKSLQEYRAILQSADIFVSTADHEFFGISVVEAVAAGCIPVVPKHLAYPEVLAGFEKNFYKPKSSTGLADKITTASHNNPMLMEKYFWSRRALELDEALRRVL